MTITKRCNRCRKPMRNDGTVQNPVWVCDNKDCVKYIPPVEDEPNEESPNNDEGGDDK